LSTCLAIHSNALLSTGGKRQRVVKDRRAYTSSELNKIFSSKLYTQGYRPMGQVGEAAYWAPFRITTLKALEPTLLRPNHLVVDRGADQHMNVRIPPVALVNREREGQPMRLRRGFQSHC